MNSENPNACYLRRSGLERWGSMISFLFALISTALTIYTQNSYMEESMIACIVLLLFTAYYWSWEITFDNKTGNFTCYRMILKPHTHHISEVLQIEMQEHMDEEHLHHQFMVIHLEKQRIRIPETCENFEGFLAFLKSR